jgi:molybdopterin biosynthesis enzyme
VVITGNEVYYGRIRDRFRPVVESKVQAVGSHIVDVRYAPDKREVIVQSMRELLDQGADLILATGGMSVDPDDVTRRAVEDAGADPIVYGASVLPGAMLMVAYIRDIPVIGIPACGMFHSTTLFDLLFPRILAGERIGREEIAALGHGGLCLNCEECRFPVCPFGK